MTTVEALNHHIHKESWELCYLEAVLIHTPEQAEAIADKALLEFISSSFEDDA